MEDNLICLINRENQSDNAFLHVKQMIEERYTYNQKYKNSIIILGYNHGKKIEYYRQNYPNKKIIIYQLEQLFDYKSHWFNPNSKSKFVKDRTNHIKDWLEKCDEIWEYDLNNKWFLEELGYNKVYFKPMIYCESLKKINSKKPKNYDILFFGSINEKRAEILSKLQNKYKIKIIGEYSFLNAEEIKNYNLEIQNSDFSNILDEYISESKIIINLHYYESQIQEQVRIFYLLINNKCVISQKSKKNYFGDLIHEFENEQEMISKIDNLLSNNKWEDLTISDRFKIKDFHNIKIGACYNSFYNVDLLKKSIESIKNVVHKIYIIHQKVSFAGNLEPEKNEKLLKDLIDENYIDEIFYFEENNLDKIDGMIMKRNKGLDLCINNNCEYILTLDNDEFYNDRDLYDHVIMMKKEGIETLFSPILSYYSNDKYFFKENFYVPSIYKIDDRIYRRGVKTSLICDPARKMTQNNYKLSNLFMHHFTYFEESFREKLGNKIMFLDPNKKNFQSVVYEKLSTWSPGKKAHIIDVNKKGENFISEKELYEISSRINLFEEKLYDLSIIISTYDNVEFIEECLISILRSSKNSNIEILIGIDGCKKTFEFFGGKNFGDNVKVFTFEKNLGPYIVKNTLSTIAKSEKILFFDSDDIMFENMIPETINILDVYDCVKPNYLEFDDNNSSEGLNQTMKSKLWGEGVFGINKKLFSEMNGFEGWRCAADSEFMRRLYKNNTKVNMTDIPLFKRRIHKKSLTSNPETNLISNLRRKYFELSQSKTDFGPLPELLIYHGYKMYTNYELPCININEPVEKISQNEKLLNFIQTKHPVIITIDREKITEKRKYINTFNRFIPHKKTKRK